MHFDYLLQWNFFELILCKKEQESFVSIELYWKFVQAWT